MRTLQVWTFSALFLASSASFAALPQPGMWGIDSEVNGKPGRGIQIDRQGGNTVLATYYGYRDDGTSTFFQAVGVMEEGKSFAADLVEYKNGTALGKNARSGEVLRVVGQVVMQFDTPSTGTILLPGETAKSFSPLVYENIQARLNKDFKVIKFSESGQSISNVRIETASNDVKFTISLGSYTCKFYGNLTQNGLSFESIGNGMCTPSSSISTYSKKFEKISVDENGMISMSVSDIDPANPINTALNGLYFGKCIKPLDHLNDATAIASPCD